MATGYLAAGTCWPSSVQALSAHLSRGLPSMVQLDYGRTRFTDFECAAGACVVSITDVSTNGTWISKGTRAMTMSFEACDMPNDPITSTLDGIALGWLVVGAMALAWKFRLMREQAR